MSREDAAADSNFARTFRISFLLLFLVLQPVPGDGELVEYVLPFVLPRLGKGRQPGLEGLFLRPVFQGFRCWPGPSR